MNELVEIFKGVSDPIRLRMVGLLLRHDELCVCDLMAALQLPQSTTSRHLAYLSRSGWLESRQDGQWRYYRLNSNMRSRQAELLEMLLRRLTDSETMDAVNTKLEAYVKTKRDC